ncbi:pancreatic lipase-related protein 3-like [Agrilus planipennis]|uniref:Pancreatic lipase-related protein 3-like n=1 Tax=Agrilus planipennis TaxID=224129 RepID=A0A1W4WYF1_AGRPL|nr:pancreatic lipase-related protein 3-like [Agrilus planipennis]
MTPPNVYIDAYKAEYVQVIHTSSKGLFTALGHADYYPNTAEQPGCEGDVECSHLRSAQYYAESVRNGGFYAIRCDCRESYSSGLCDNNPLSYLGGEILDTRANGSYFLDTYKRPPFSKD